MRVSCGAAADECAAGLWVHLEFSAEIINQSLIISARLLDVYPHTGPIRPFPIPTSQDIMLVVMLLLLVGSVRSFTEPCR